MTRIELLAEKDEAATGRFTGLTDSLLPLFADPDARVGRRWQQLFGIAPPEPPERRGIRFTVSVRRRSSSGS